MNYQLTDFEDSLYRLMRSIFTNYRGVKIEKVSSTDFIALSKHFSNIQDAKKYIDESMNNYKNLIHEK